MRNDEVLTKELGKRNGSMNNKVRGCECAPEYEVAQKWNDGRIRLSVRCELAPNIMLDPDGTFRVRLYKGLSDFLEDRKEMMQEIKNIKEKNERKDCELLWDDKTYTFKGYY
jgi:hypothetical protein